VSQGETPDRTTALTLFTVIGRPRATVWLRLIFWLATKLPLPRWTLLRLKLIHYARWSILSREGLRRPYLFFESNFNGSPDAYVEAFSYAFPLGMRAIWGSSQCFPGPTPVETLRKWIRRGQHHEQHYYCAYPDASTREVLAGLEVRRRVGELVSRTQGADPAEFAKEYGALVSGLQWDI